MQLSSSDEGSADDANVPGEEQQKRAKISDWTRIKSYSEFKTLDTEVFNIESDLEALRAEEVEDVDSIQMEELVYFDPETFKGQDKELTIADYALTQDQLLEYGKMATKIRTAFDVKA